MDGLYQRGKGKNWYVDKQISGYGRFYKSTGTTDKAEAESRAIKWLAEINERVYHGANTVLTLEQAAAMYVEAYASKKSMDDDIVCLKRIMPFIGHWPIANIHERSIAPMKSELVKHYKSSTINRSLAILQLILKKCANVWRDELNNTYLDSPPILDKLKERDKKRTPYQSNLQLIALGQEMNDFFKAAYTFALHTSLREKSQAALEWSWLHEEQGIQFFWIPAEHMKSGRAFMCVLNDVASSIVDELHGQHEKYVFPSPRGGRYWKFNSKHFDNARSRAGLKDAVNWHSARATFNTRLHKLGVDKDDMAVLMDHSQTITMHYVTPQIIYLHSVLQKLVPEMPDLRKIHANKKGLAD